MISAPASQALLDFTASLVERAARIRDPRAKVDPRDDNMLKVTTDGRKASLDLRLINPALPDDPRSKVNQLVRNVWGIWAQTRDERAAQLVFCDLSVPHPDGRFNVYDDVRTKLVARGVPPAEIAFAQDATTPRRKAALQAAIRTGRIRIALGSTSNLGTGLDIQDRIIALHHLDAPFRPSDVAQRDGRGARRGNRYLVIDLFRYVTARSFDAYLWTLLCYKLEMTSRVMLGDPTIREIEDDNTVLSYAEVKALAAGNPLILERAHAVAEIARLRRARSSFLDRRLRERAEHAENPHRLARAENQLRGVKADLAQWVDTRGDAFRVTIEDREYDSRPKAGAVLLRFLQAACYCAEGREVIEVGRFAGFPLFASVHARHDVWLLLRGARDYRVEIGLHRSAMSLIQSLEAAPRRIDALVAGLADEVRHLRGLIAEADGHEERTFAREDELQRLTARLREIDRALRDPREPESSAGTPLAPLPMAA